MVSVTQLETVSQLQTADQNEVWCLRLARGLVLVDWRVIPAYIENFGGLA
jgi:hypothetical protein